MPKLSGTAVPSYRRHKQSGQGIVTLSGRDFLLGKYDTTESRDKYNRLIAEWLEAKCQRLSSRERATLEHRISAAVSTCVQGMQLLREQQREEANRESLRRGRR